MANPELEKPDPRYREIIEAGIWETAASSKWQIILFSAPISGYIANVLTHSNNLTFIASGAGAAAVGAAVNHTPIGAIVDKLHDNLHEQPYEPRPSEI